MRARPQNLNVLAKLYVNQGVAAAPKQQPGTNQSWWYDRLRQELDYRPVMTSKALAADVMSKREAEVMSLN